MKRCRSNRRGRAVLERALLALLPLGLVACGGGGDAGAALTPPYDLDAPITKALTAGAQTGNLTYTDAAGNVYTLTLRYAPMANAVFEGALYKAALQTITIDSGGVKLSESATVYFRTGPYAEAGAIRDDGSYIVSSRTGDLPTAARVGSSGPLSNDTGYTDSGKATVQANAVTSWSLEADTGTTAFGCIKSVALEASQASTNTQTICFRIDTAGDLLPGARVTFTLDGQALEFR